MNTPYPMPAAITIVPVTANEVGLLSQLSGRTFHDAFAKLNHEPDVQHYIDTIYNEDNLHQELHKNDSYFYFAKAGDTVAGYLKLNFTDSQTEFQEPFGMEIQRIYVDSCFQGQRIGEQLIHFTTEQATARNCSYMWLGVWEHNTGAIRFYQRLGFSIFGQHEFLLGSDLQTDLLMRKEI